SLCNLFIVFVLFFFFQAEDGIRDRNVTGVQTCALPISYRSLASVGHRHESTLSLVGASVRPSCESWPSDESACRQAETLSCGGIRLGSHRASPPRLCALRPSVREGTRTRLP